MKSTIIPDMRKLTASIINNAQTSRPTYKTPPVEIVYSNKKAKDTIVIESKEKNKYSKVFFDKFMSLVNILLNQFFKDAFLIIT